jgi:hypothetical protein
MEQRPSWEADSHSANREIPRVLWNPKVHYRVRRNPLVPRFCVTFRNKLLLFSWREIGSTSQVPQCEGPPIVGCPRQYIEYNRSYPPYLETVSSIRISRTRRSVETWGPHNVSVRCFKVEWICFSGSMCSTRMTYRQCTVNTDLYRRLFNRLCTASVCALSPGSYQAQHQSISWHLLR